MTDIATEDQAAVVRRLSAEVDRLSMWGPNDLRKLADLEAENEQLRERVAALQASSGYEACIAQVEIEHLQTVIARAHAMRIAKNAEIERLRALWEARGTEIDRLQAEHDDYMVRANANVCELNREIKRLKAELARANDPTWPRDG